MFVIPSIRLESDRPRASAVESVREWEREGFSRMQLVLGSTERPLPEERLIEEVLRDLRCPVQVVGRFESTEEIDSAIDAGAGFVTLGPRALDELEWLSAVTARFPGQLLLSSPARERRSRTRGAMRTLPLDLRDLAMEVAGLPLAGLVVEFTPEVTVGHPELALLEDVAEEVEFPVQVAMASPDLAMLRDLEFRGIAAAIIDAAHLAAEFDAQTLARSFPD